MHVLGTLHVQAFFFFFLGDLPPLSDASNLSHMCRKGKWAVALVGAKKDQTSSYYFLNP